MLLLPSATSGMYKAKTKHEQKVSLRLDWPWTRCLAVIGRGFRNRAQNSGTIFRLDTDITLICTLQEIAKLWGGSAGPRPVSANVLLSLSPSCLPLVSLVSLGQCSPDGCLPVSGSWKPPAGTFRRSTARLGTPRIHRSALTAASTCILHTRTCRTQPHQGQISAST